LRKENDRSRKMTVISHDAPWKVTVISHSLSVASSPLRPYFDHVRFTLSAS
jgi:hypothetical protein